MVSNAEKYVYTVYLEKSFSRAAEKLFVSQPALSSVIKKHEKALGYEIFNRKTLPVTLTNRGEVYIDYLHELYAIDEQLRQRLDSIGSGPVKTISIGGSNSAASIIIPRLCGEYHRQYPDVNIKIDVGEIGELSNLKEKFENGTLDILITSNESSPKYRYVPLWEEKYMLVVCKDYKGAEKLHKYSLTPQELSSGVYPDSKVIKDMASLKGISIFKPGRNRKASKIFPDLFSDLSSGCFSIKNFRKMDMHYSLMLEGLGAVLMPQTSIIKNGYNPDTMCCFALGGEENLRRVVLMHKDESNLPSCVLDFIAIAKKIYNNNSEVQI